MHPIARREAFGVPEPTHRRGARTRAQLTVQSMQERALALYPDRRLARALGWFSIGLGMAEILMPRRLARTIGAPRGAALLLPLLGAREVATGLGILNQSTSVAWVRSRIAGDVIDLALLGAALRARRARKTRLMLTTAAVVSVTAADVACAELLSRRAGATRTGAVRVRKSIAILRPAGELYAFFSDLENLPRIMRHLHSVRRMDERRSHWLAAAPAGMSVEWDAEVTEQREGERIAWRALPGSDVPNHGAIEFRPLPAGHGTLLRVDLQYEPPAGQLGAAVASLFGEEPGQQIAADLRRFKQLMETGEVATSAGPHGERGPFSRVLP